MQDFEAKVKQAAETAFIDRTRESLVDYQPQFVYNDYHIGKKVLSSIESELAKCESFYFSVAFITEDGVEPLLQTLKELDEKGIHGKIITTDYLTFTSPKALSRLARFSCVELRMFTCQDHLEGFHTKGYIFKRDDGIRALLGSSNLTGKALAVNKEWNTRIVSSEDGAFGNSLLEEFQALWKVSVPYGFYRETYEQQYAFAQEQKRIAAAYLREHAPVDELQKVLELKPNAMQQEFLKSFEDLLKEKKSKGLLISATGTGKTYAAAFAVRQFKPRKFLFVVHRETIAKQAMESFKRVLGPTAKMGFLCGATRDYDAQYLFATIQTLSKPEVYTQLGKDAFDLIVVDEVHRAGAASYQTVMEYFEPEFWLGMTASPERTDGYDIYSLFDHNIAYEIHLAQALEEDMLCPFHYFGIQDLVLDSREITDESDFRFLTCDERVKHIQKELDFYGYSGDRPKGLIFVSRKEEAHELSRKFNELGYRTAVLTGDSKEEEREVCIERLESDEREDYLEYIFTVDIFNEGVDIPSVNQIVMLRPTQSPIIFIQQFGRGLRKCEGKDFVVILDFIGNYNNNYMIPAAFHEKIGNKDVLRKTVSEGAKILKGTSTIHFDEVSRNAILTSIDHAKFQKVKILRESYMQVRQKLGRVPTLMEFEEYASIDTMVLLKECDSYEEAKIKFEKWKDYPTTEEELEYIRYITKKFANGKRPHELIILKAILEGQTQLFTHLKETLEKRKIPFDELAYENLINLLQGKFVKAINSNVKLIEPNNSKIELIGPDGKKQLVVEYGPSLRFLELLQKEVFRAACVEVVNFGFYRYSKYYKDANPQNNLVLYEKYSYFDVCRLMNWEYDYESVMNGYFYDKRTKTFPVFINYKKAEDIQASIQYKDRFTSETSLIAISKSKRTICNKDMQTIKQAKELGITIELFVRKNKDDEESKEFYYLGPLSWECFEREFIMENTSDSAVEIRYSLEHPVREDLYHYITAG